MDKYYMLIRRFINASFRLLSRENWEEGLCDQYNDILTCRGAPLRLDNLSCQLHVELLNTIASHSYDDNRVPTSLAYHLADIYLEELNKVLTNADDSTLPAPLSILLAPFITLASRTNNSVTLQRVFSSLFDPLLAAIDPHTSDEPMSKRIKLDFDTSFVHIAQNSCLRNPKEEGKLSKAELKRGIVKQMFEAASSPDVRGANRRRMHAVWKAAMAEEEEAEEAESDT
jgi:ribosomal RNA-processing protein 1